MVRALSALVCCVPVLMFTGCDGVAVVPVSGTLTYKGKPVTNAFVTFQPEGGRPSTGATDKDGRFTLTYDPERKGAAVGKHRVYVTHNSLADANVRGAVPGMPTPLTPELKEMYTKFSPEKSVAEVTVERATDDLKLDWN